jgi:hypothetical protein
VPKEESLLNDEDLAGLAMGDEPEVKPEIKAESLFKAADKK